MAAHVSGQWSASILTPTSGAGAAGWPRGEGGWGWPRTTTSCMLWADTTPRPPTTVPNSQIVLKGGRNSFPLENMHKGMLHKHILDLLQVCERNSLMGVDTDEFHTGTKDNLFHHTDALGGHVFHHFIYIKSCLAPSGGHRRHGRDRTVHRTVIPCSVALRKMCKRCCLITFLYTKLDFSKEEYIDRLKKCTCAFGIYPKRSCRT